MPTAQKTIAGFANPHAATQIDPSTSSGQATMLTYDNNGNLLTDGVHTNVWNYRNRLMSSSVASSTSSYVYDYTDARIKTVENGITTYLPSKYFTTFTGANATSTKYVFAGDLLLATIDKVGASTTTSYVHTDHLGSTNVVTNASGAVIETEDYYAYGAPRVDTKSNGYTGQRRGYIGQEYDKSTQFSYLQARYYNPIQSQFISEDPVFWEIGMSNDGKAAMVNPQSQNSYSYAGDNPIVNKDTNGRMFGVDDAIGFAVGGVIAVAIQRQEYEALGMRMTLGDAAGAYVNGGIMGVGIVNIPETDGLSYLAAARVVGGAAAKNGAIAGAAGDILRQGTDLLSGAQESVSASDMIANTAFSAASNAALELALPGVAAAGITAGKGSWAATYKSVMTKAEKGSVKNISASTSLKGAAAAQTAGAYKSIGGAVLDAAKTKATTPSKSTKSCQK